METKKSKKAELESKRPVFFIMGLLISLSLTLLAFEWKTPVEKSENLGELKLDAPIEEMTPLVQEEKKEIAPPVKEVITFEIVDNEAEIDNNLEIFDSEIETDEAIQIQDVIQKENEEEENVPAVWFVDEMPEFPGGMPSLLKFINNAIKYPIVAQENGIQGKVIITFVIGKTGEVIDAKVFRGIDPALDAEALRVVKTLPDWKPGKQNGKAVKVNYNVPINFVLR